MLKVDDNFYVLPRGEQVAKMVEYSVRLTNDGVSEQADPTFIPEFLESVSGRYTWQLDGDTARGQLLYNSAVLNVLSSLLNDDHQDVDVNTARFLDIVENPEMDIKTRRLAMVGLHTLVELDTPFVVSSATANDVAETLAGVALCDNQDHLLRHHCIETMADLLKQKRVPFSQSFAAVSQLPEAFSEPVFHAPQRHYT